APTVSNVAPVSKDDAQFLKNLEVTPTVVVAPKDADGTNTTGKQGAFLYQQDAPSCSDCGSIMVRNGACYKCLNCGSTSGCSCQSIWWYATSCTLERHFPR